MVKQILSADNNLYTKINAILSREPLLEETYDSFIPLVACGVPTEIIIQVQSIVDHWVIIGFSSLKIPIANELFFSLITTIANIIPESMTGDLALPSDTL